MYYLTKFDDEIESDIWVILKITSANLCKPIYDIISYSTSIRCFESGKCGKEGKKLQKWDISREWKELFRSNKKTFFIVFEGLLFNEKIKIWKKIAGTSFKSFLLGFGRFSSELAQLAPLPRFLGWSTWHSDRFHDFFCHHSKDVYVNSFFSDTVRIWNSLPIECFPFDPCSKWL